MGNFKIIVSAKNSSEATVIENTLKEPDIKAFVLIVGMLKGLPVDVRNRVLDYTKSRNFWHKLQEAKPK